jgi:transcription elongation factor SPT6
LPLFAFRFSLLYTHSDDEDDEDDDKKRGGTRLKKKKSGRLKKKKGLTLDDDDHILIQDNNGWIPDRHDTKLDKDQDKKRRDPDDYDEDNDEDDVNDFIDDADDATGVPAPRRLKNSEHSMQDAMQLRDAADLFKVDLEDIERMQRAGGAVQNDVDYNEDEDDDDDYVGLDPSHVNKKMQKQKSIQLKRNYEPGLLEAQYISERDDKIRSKDIPERLQLHIPVDLLDQTDSERQEEATWISNHLKSTASPNAETVRASVTMVLEFLQTEKLEIPFIKCYKEDCWKDVLTEENLWEIYDLVGRWGTFVKLRATADKVCEDVLESLQGIDAEGEGQTTSTVSDTIDEVRMYKSLLPSVQLESGLQYLQEQVSLLSNSNVSEISEKKKKNAQRRSRNANKFKLCKKEGLLKFASTFCISPIQYGEQLQRVDTALSQGSGAVPERLYEPPCPEDDVDTATTKEAERYLPQSLFYFV